MTPATTRVVDVMSIFVVYCNIKTRIKKSAVSGIKGSVCLSTTDHRVSVTPWLGEPPCDPNPPARPKAFSKYSFDLGYFSKQDRD